MACYEAECRPWQLDVERAMRTHGMMDCSMPGCAAGGGVGRGIKLTIMKDPWPEMDICVGGVDKGSALARFVRHPKVRPFPPAPLRLASLGPRGRAAPSPCAEILISVCRDPDLRVPSRARRAGAQQPAC